VTAGVFTVVVATDGAGVCPPRAAAADGLEPADGVSVVVAGAPGDADEDDDEGVPAVALVDDGR
jgi:hypothetical protein